MPVAALSFCFETLVFDTAVSIEAVHDSCELVISPFISKYCLYAGIVCVDVLKRGCKAQDWCSQTEHLSL